MRSVAARLFQIAYSPASRAAVEPGFEVLDNLANERADWYEYAPVRRYLMQETLAEDAFYGFFSTKFGAKTGHRRADVDALIERHGAAADVLLFSAHPNQIAFFTNVFEQGEFFHPGLAAAAGDWLRAAGVALPVPPQQLLMDVCQIVYCNFFVARPAFWRAWLALGETLWAICEGPPGELRQRLTTPTSYAGGAQMKIFLMERMASLLLATQPRWRSVAADPYAHGLWPHESLRRDPTDAIVSDALKHAMRSQPWPEYADAFGAVRRRITGAA
ncbi:MAG: hypothetical protein KGN16_24035 [Burkholderiales bacterium]|nr:hypothetical protein [Burkholderiales bacterium]